MPLKDISFFILLFFDRKMERSIYLEQKILFQGLFQWNFTSKQLDLSQK